jgi:hypothetical protein
MALFLDLSDQLLLIQNRFLSRHGLPALGSTRRLCDGEVPNPPSPVKLSARSPVDRRDLQSACHKDAGRDTDGILGNHRTPDGRIRSVASGRVLSQVRLGGLHHRYNRAAQSGSTLRRSSIYIRALHARSGSRPPESSCCIDAMIVFRRTQPGTPRLGLG